MKNFKLQLLNGKLTLCFYTEREKLVTRNAFLYLYELSNNTGRNLESGLRTAKKKKKKKKKIIIKNIIIKKQPRLRITRLRSERKNTI